MAKISLNLWATAIHRPALTTAKSAEPFGVADLFRQCLQSAISYDAVRKQSHRRLQFTLFGVAALVAVIAVLALALYLGRPPEGLQKLIDKVQLNLPSNDSPEAIGSRVDAADAVKKSPRRTLATKFPWSFGTGSEGKD